MASDAVFVDYVRDQLGGAGAISFRRMFGEYAMYCDGKVVGLVCDNQLFVKPTLAGREFLGAGVVEGQPYQGAKPWLLSGESLDDRTTVCRLIRITADALPMPAPKKPKASKAPVKRAAVTAPGKRAAAKPKA